ncbi:MAG: serine/threonine-protein phosphatase [Symploca sp. SIO2G7]|nr:serine/threonine-protein phosphatase [Symploca sp. SIO2G7]
MSSSEPLTNFYLWADAEPAIQIGVGEEVAYRYQVVAPQIWQDTLPEIPPEIPEELDGRILPYLRLYPYRLHIPEVYGVCKLPELGHDPKIILLGNVPIQASGELYPTIESAWSKASAVRQVYWLWQIWELWKPLEELGVASSLLVPDNLRVEGWRLRLLQLYTDPAQEKSTRLATESAVSSPNNTVATAGEAGIALMNPPMTASLQKLGERWAIWCRKASGSVAEPLQEIAEQLQTEQPPLDAIASQLNQLLLEQAALQPLRLQVAGATDSGPNQSHNEDACYPTTADLPTDSNQSSDPLIPHLSIICDGIGGHEGGEVASKMVVESIKLQVRGLLAELAEDPEIMTPELVAQQLEAIIRVANNLIASSNDQQARESRRRMGTTITMALQLPQKVQTKKGMGNAHELYIASVGDSRAYWMTPRYCQQLTVDDDVVTREVKMARSLKVEALERSDAGALTQAVGPKDGEFLHPTVQRFILEEDGLLLLCSDGLSDNDWLEQLYRDYPRDIFSEKLSLEAAVESLIDLANQKNGHDNTSVVITYCRVTPEFPVVLNLAEITQGSDGYGLNFSDSQTFAPTSFNQTEPNGDLQELTAESSEEPPTAALVTTNSATSEFLTTRGSWFKVMLGVVGVLIVLLSSGTALLTAQWLLDPEGFKQMRQRLFKPEQLKNPDSEFPTSQE